MTKQHFFKQILLVFLIFSIFFVAGIIVNGAVFAADNGLIPIPVLTDEQILSAKNNGMISAICFVLDIITGSFARAVFALSVIVLGWLFLIGEVKDYKPIFFFCLSISIVLGATNIANILSGNRYSCDYFREIVEKEDETIYNKGVCIVSEIDDYYSPSQTWRYCIRDENDANGSSLDISKCANIVDNNTTITPAGNIKDVVLYECQDGYFKDANNAYLYFRCTDYGFELINQANSDNAKCRKACTSTDLKSLSSTYKFDYNSLSKKGTNGRAEDNGKYFTRGYQFSADCNSGYIEYNEDGNMDNNGITITCNDNGTFGIVGSCKNTCNIKTTKFSRNVLYWKKCDENNNCVRTTDSTFYYGDTLEIDTCNYGYSLSNVYDNKTRITCSNNGSWVIEEFTDADGNKNYGNQCVKKCDLLSIENISNSVVETVCESGDSDCTPKEITSGIFEIDQKVMIKDCKSGYSVDHGKNKGVFVCTSDGTWELQEGTSACNMYCDITTLTGYSNMERVYYSTMDDTEDRRLLDLSIKEIPSGYRLELDTCKAGYSYDTNEKPFIAVCQNGKYKYYNEGNNCVQKCNYKDLVSNIDQKALSWYQVNRSGEKIIDGKTIISSTGKDQYDSVDVETGTYFSINTCADGYSTPEDNAIIVQCRNGGWRVISNSTGICMEGCKNNDIFNNVIGLTSMIETNKSGNVLEPEHTITADGGITKAGLYFKPNSCGDGYGIYKDEAAIFRCYGGIWSVVKNNDYLCMPDCNNSDLFSTLHNIKSLIETDSAGNIVNNATILENGNGKTKAGKAFKIYECNDGFEVNKFKSIVLECYRGGWRITRNSSGLCITTNN